MPVTAEQLGRIYTEIRKRFLSSTLVSIVPVEGDPPEKYQIVYTLSGKCLNSTKEVIEGDKHIVEITIPFGFPHFPPSCTPVTPIFHPDFATDAISIGDFWAEKKSLSDLIIHIGEMINGTFYSTTNSFNDEAIQWYQENREQFPLAFLQWHENAPKIPPQNHPIEQDSLTEAQLSPSNFETTANNLEHDKLDSFLLLKQEKAFSKLQRELKGLAEYSPALSTLFKETSRVIEKAERHYKKARSKEKKGAAQEALSLYRKVAKSVSDYPAIQADISRMEQHLPMMEQKDHAVEDINSPQNSAQPLSEQKKHKILSLFYSRKALLLILPLLVGVSLLYFFAKQRIESAESSLQNCTTSLEKGAFHTADRECNHAKKRANSILLFFPKKKAELIASAETILQSEVLLMGLSGKVIIDGKTYPADKAQQIISYKKQRRTADKLYLARQFKKAATEYTTALQIADNENFLDEEPKQALKNLANSARFHSILQLAEKQKEQEKWPAMRHTTEEAQALLDTLPQSERLQFGPVLILKKIEARFGMMKKEVDDALRQGKWAEALHGCNKLLKLAEQHPDIFPAEQKKIRKQQARASLYLSLEEGNNAFIEKKWNVAIAAYTKANTILTDPKLTLFAKEESEQNNRRLKKIILQAAIVRERESIKELLDNDELKSARDMYRKMLKLIQGSNFRGEQEFAKVDKEIRSKIENLNHQLYRNDKQAYLEKNYRQLFSRFYPSLDEKSLQSPEIRFMEEDNKRLLFRLQCTEKRPGARPLTLLMTCRYDKQSGKWRIVTTPQ